MNKSTLYTVGYMATLLLLAGCLCEWAAPIEFGGTSYGCGEDMPGFTVYDAVKVVVSAALICAWGIIGQNLVVRACADIHEDETSEN